MSATATQADEANGQQQPAPPPVFTKAGMVKDVTIRVFFDVLYPGVTFVFVLKTQLVGEADRLRQEYLALPTAERRAGTTEHNVTMLSHLLVHEPAGVGDFPAPGYDGDEREKREEDLRARALAYFGERDADGRFVMEWLVTAVMGRYWNAVYPTEYL